MPVTWVDTPGSTLATRSEPIDFTVTGTSGVGNTPGVSPGTFQPLSHSPVGAWPLADSAGLSLVDRSGHGYGLTGYTPNHNPSAVTDTLTGTWAMGNGMTSLLSSPAALRILGPLTITLRVRATAAVAGMVFIQHAAQNEQDVDNVLYEFGVTATTLTPLYRAESGAGVDIVATADTSLNLSLLTWHFVALRRAADGAVTFNVDARPSATVAGLPLPSVGTSGLLYVGGGIAGLQYNDLNRALKDVMLWNVRLTDAQLDAQRTGMGL